MDAVYHLALSKPYVESLSWSDLADIRPSLPGGGLLDDVLRPSRRYEAAGDADQFHSWHGRKAAAAAAAAP